MLKLVQSTEMPYENLLKQRQSIAGASYLVTFCTRNRRPVLNGDIADLCGECLSQQQIRGLCENLAWVIMPDHIHWLFSLLQTDVGIHQMVGRCKAAISRRVSLGSSRAFWQNGFHERQIRNERELRAHARYLVANPLRAGIVSHLRDHPWWYAKWAPPPHGPAVGGAAERLLD